MRSDIRLGEQLVAMGVIDSTELRAMLSVQSELREARRRVPLMRLLVDCGLVEKARLERALVRERQRKLMTLALSSAVLSVPTGTKASDTGRIQVAAVVMARASIESQQLPSEVTVSAEDLDRGYIEVPVEIGVRSNSAVVLAFSANSRELAGVEVASGSPSLAQPERGLRAQIRSFLLRLRLAPGAKPGRIAFPVSVSLTPRS